MGRGTKEIYNVELAKSPKREIIEQKFYKGIKYYIRTNGKCPYCYVGLNFCLSEEEVELIDIHGGISWNSNFIPGISDRKDMSQVVQVLGWDYAHAGDYYEGLYEGRKWTYEEILEHVYFVIDQIVAIKIRRSNSGNKTTEQIESDLEFLYLDFIRSMHRAEVSLEEIRHKAEDALHEIQDRKKIEAINKHTNDGIDK